MPPRSPMLRLLLVLRVILGAAFVYFGGEKLFRLESFIGDVGNYELLGPRMEVVVGYLVPWLEVVTGMLLMVGWLRRGALVVLGGLVVVFMVGIGQAWARGLEISCGCFGSGGEPSNYPLHLALNAAILVVIGLLLSEGRFAPKHLFGGRKLRLP